MKKRIMKIILVFIACATVSLNFTPVQAAANIDDTFNVSLAVNNNQELTFKIIEAGKVQLGTGNQWDANLGFTGAVTIPETVEYKGQDYEVVKIADSAFSNFKAYNKNITSIIGNSITSIGSIAFMRCSLLESINFPEATYIGGGAFTSCTGLTSITLPSATCIEAGAFGDCTKLTTINLPSAINIIYNAFYGCTEITSINLPKVTDIDELAFAECRKLTNISLPSAINIGNQAFYLCEKLISINLPKVKVIGEAAFVECVELTNISLPSAINIEEYAFRWCEELISINLPRATSIGHNAFSGCKSLKSMVLGITNESTYTFENIGKYPETIYLLPNVNEVIFDGNLYGGTITAYDINIETNPVSVIQELGTAATLSVDATISLEDPWKELSYQWEKKTNDTWGTLDGETNETLTIDSLKKEDAGMYQCKVTSVANPALEKTTSSASITVNPSVEESVITGIVEGTTYKKGITLDVSIAGAGMGNMAPIEGAIRYQPKSWKVDSNTGSFADTSTTKIETKDLTVGNKTLEVTFDQQIYKGGNWTEVTRSTSTKNINFILVETVNEKDTEGTKLVSPKTGDPTNVGYLSLGLMISGIIILGCLKKKKITR